MFSVGSARCTEQMRPPRAVQPVARSVTRRLGASSRAVNRRRAAERVSAQKGQGSAPWAAGVVAAGIVMGAIAAGPATAFADKVGEFPASGFIFKDTVDVIVFDDPEVKNVSVYISEMQRSLSEKLSGNFFNEPSQASIGCAATGVPELPDPKSLGGSEGKELFSQGRNLNFVQQKSLRVRRIYDPNRNVVLYIAYSTRLSGGDTSVGRYKTSICAVPLPTPQPAPAEPATPPKR